MMKALILHLKIPYLGLGICILDMVLDLTYTQLFDCQVLMDILKYNNIWSR